MVKHRLAVLGALVVGVHGAGAFAASPFKDAAPHSSISGGERRSLVERIGVAHGVELLVAGDRASRLRGLERLGRQGGRAALDALKGALLDGPILLDPRTRLQAARSLAPHALSDEGRTALLGILSHPLAEDASLAEGALARDVAVLALARAAAGKVERPVWLQSPMEDLSGVSAEERALTPLLGAVIAGSAIGEVAQKTLALHPPIDLVSFLRGVATPTVPEVRLLGQLGDLRALPMLRRALGNADRLVQLEAVLALARLGDHTASASARSWLAHLRGLPPLLRVTQVEALLTLGAADGPAAMLPLFKEGLTSVAALGLAERWPTAVLLPALETFVDGPSTLSEKVRALKVVARIGGDAAVAILGKKLGSTSLGVTALLELAVLPGAAAHDVLLKTLVEAKGAARCLSLRAWLVRAKILNDLPARVVVEFERAFAAEEPTERAVGALALTLLERVPLALTLGHADVVVVSAALSAAAMLGPRGAAALVPFALRALERGPHFATPDETDGTKGAFVARADALGAVAIERERIDEAALAILFLARPEVGSTSALVQWIEAGGVASPQAAYRLASRDPASFRERVTALLASTSPLVRVHTALGLGDSPEPDAVTRLVGVYRFETDVRVRRAIVRALSRRHERTRVELLEQALTLDPDSEVRFLAGSALTGTRHELELFGGDGLVWLPLVPSDGGDVHAVQGRAVWHVQSNGLAMTSISPPDGLVLAFGAFVESRVVPLW